jgi:hypothetical protein
VWGVPNDQDLDNAIEAIVVDAYGADEQHSAFLAVIEDETLLPTAATLLGTPVTVTSIDYTNEARGIVATCQGPDGAGEVTLADLAFPSHTVTAWIHAAYRRYLGLTPFPARPRPEWTWPNT